MFLACLAWGVHQSSTHHHHTSNGHIINCGNALYHQIHYVGSRAQFPSPRCAACHIHTIPYWWHAAICVFVCVWKPMLYVCLLDKSRSKQPTLTWFASSLTSKLRTHLGCQYKSSTAERGSASWRAPLFAIPGSQCLRGVWINNLKLGVVDIRGRLSFKVIMRQAQWRENDTKFTCLFDLIGWFCIIIARKAAISLINDKA